ncbi:hypothetical protein LWC08_15260 (plasmid) [Desulfobaculum bizertense]|uniref:hypothetical protein n=1 Tax=Desulfobaculum bizertense TaxID=376490 RepID=UPI001F174D49|nr:hypothetical protein [Desulfobaculum bizertense]UIJ39557.1 hypothetical protein LWC08_15260 [Desulfobaculum bizertense]
MAGGAYSEMLRQGQKLAEQEKNRKKKTATQSKDDMTASLLADLESNPYEQALQNKFESQKALFRSNTPEKSKRQIQHTNPTYESNTPPTKSEESATSSTTRRHLTSVPLNHEEGLGDKKNSSSPGTNPTHESNTQTQHTDPTHESNRGYVGPDCWKRVLDSKSQHTNPTGGVLDPTHESNTRIQHTDPTHETENPTQQNPPKNFLNFKKIVRTKSQKKVWAYLEKFGDQITTNALIHKETGVAIGTVRDILRKFEREGFLEKKKWADTDGRQGLKITLKIPHFANPTHESNTQIQLSDPTVGFALLERKKEYSLTKENNVELKTDSTLQHPIHSQAASEWDLTEKNIAAAWPLIHQKGWGRSQLSQLKPIFDARDIPFDIVRQALNYVEWELKEHGEVRDKAQKPVSDPVAWLFVALKKTGYYAKPLGYESPAEKLAREQAEEAQRIRAYEQKAAQNGYSQKSKKAMEWFHDLSEDEQQIILYAQPGGGHEPNVHWILREWSRRNDSFGK